jgi:hypothetical protein
MDASDYRKSHVLHPDRPPVQSYELLYSTSFWLEQKEQQEETQWRQCLVQTQSFSSR